MIGKKTITNKNIKKELVRYLTTWTHFRNRLLERYNIRISQDEYKKIVKDVKAKKMEQCLILKKDDGSKVYKILIHGMIVEAVYNTRTKLLSTVLPKWKNKLKIK